MVVGLTGGIGSGKSTVLSFFEAIDKVSVYKADEEAKKLMNSSKVIREKLTDKFGVEAYIDNSLNREYIANIVFKDKTKLKALNAIVHPEVYKHFNAFIKANNYQLYIVYENAILFENKSDVLCDKIITVTASEEEKIKRVIKRDSTTEKLVRDRMKNQWKDAKKMLQSHYIICNNDLEKTKQEVFKIHNKLTKNIL